MAPTVRRKQDQQNICRSKGKLTAASRYNYIGTPFNATVEVKETYQYGGKGGRLSQKETNNIFNGAQSEQSVRPSPGTSPESSRATPIRTARIPPSAARPPRAPRGTATPVAV
jgi:hypothetical protein